MTATVKLADAPINSSEKWESIDWQTIEESVRKLQMRIAKAVKSEKFRKAKSLQWLLTHSYHAKLLAIKRVTTNKGKRTPGVDKVVWSTSRQKMNAINLLRRRGYRPRPLRRIYIPKKNRRKKRPLSIPVMVDRAFQALYKLALDPVAETLADANSYGFRKHRRCADAIGQCFVTLARGDSAAWILEADIKACFDEISHKWMIEHILMDKQILKKWLKAGYMEKGEFYPTRRGTPQGGIISPVLANMVLDGLESTVKNAVKNSVSGRPKVNFVRYADDFIITGISKALLEDTVKPVVEMFLCERGLSLSKEKTKITKIEKGFDFLGQNLRKYNGKLLIKPTKENVKLFLRDIKKIIREHRGREASTMINILNPKIRGWANYHRHVVSGKTFSYIDTFVYHTLWRWMKHRHPNKNLKWLADKYWNKGSKPWTFSTTVKNEKGKTQRVELIKAGSINIERHIKIKGYANPFDPEYREYFRMRKYRKTYGKKQM